MNIDTIILTKILEKEIQKYVKNNNTSGLDRVYAVNTKFNIWKSVNVIQHTKEEKPYDYFIRCRKTVNKIKYRFMTKTFNKLDL